MATILEVKNPALGTEEYVGIGLSESVGSARSLLPVLCLGNYLDFHFCKTVGNIWLKISRSIAAFQITVQQ